MSRHGKGRCENRAINEQLFVEGATGYLSNDLIHEDRRGIGDWIAKHNRYASREALELARTEQERRSNELDARLMGSQAERKRWIRRHVWNRLPPLVRPFAYFCYRYVLRLGFWTASRASRFTSYRRSGTRCSSISSTSNCAARERQSPEIPMTDYQTPRGMTAC